MSHPVLTAGFKGLEDAEAKPPAGLTFTQSLTPPKDLHASLAALSLPSFVGLGVLSASTLVVCVVGGCSRSRPCSRLDNTHGFRTRSPTRSPRTRLEAELERQQRWYGFQNELDDERYEGVIIL